MPLPPLDVTAARAGYWHGGQTDKAGAPYVGHLIRVQAHLLRLFPDASEVERHAAWLHDVLEDTAITAHDLAEIGYPDDLIALASKVMSGAALPAIDISVPLEVDAKAGSHWGEAH